MGGLKAFCDALSASPVSLTLQSTAWVVPAVQTVHILALSVVLASMAMFSARLIGLPGGGASLSDSARRFLPPTWASLVVLLATGAVLIVAEPARELLNPAFRWKMVLVVAGVVISLGLNRVLRRGGTSSAVLRLVGVLFLAIWLTIALLGRWIAYVDTGL